MKRSLGVEIRFLTASLKISVKLFKLIGLA
ncbi:hypothetical protein N871_04045 [Helicobacter pylori X47-2AL]|uniref:Uncharacterized protein n=1 Tax=Helicobacter pylori X47-2AL TaxID=1386083 RepID=V6LIG8_HELPX|nr:hypothetical protein N871_04045 [Helicobacter pylori X47-2AL]